jgi:Mn2+/Fe2+ NRAMP family transporter
MLGFLSFPGFYGVLVWATAVSTLIDFTTLDPIKALVWSAVVNGVIAVPIMAVMMWLGRHPTILGQYTLTRRHQVLGWFATLVMLMAVMGMVAGYLRGDTKHVKNPIK